MQAMSANSSAPRAPQRSPFAIQELLGLSEGRDGRDRYLDGRDDRVLNLAEGREVRGFAPQFPLPAAMASRVAYAAAFNAQAAVAAAFLPGPPLLHPPPGESKRNQKPARQSFLRRDQSKNLYQSILPFHTLINPKGIIGVVTN